MNNQVPGFHIVVLSKTGNTFMKGKSIWLTWGFFFAMAMGLHAEEGCLTCHRGIERISDVPEMADLTCTECHRGNGTATDIQEAHKGMWANPSDFRVVDEVCGECHEEEVRTTKLSLHATMAGKINGTRYAWGAQSREAIYATYDVSDDDPQGVNALASLKQVPAYDPSKPESATNNPADDYLRNQCLRCHLWSDGHQRDGDYRASGCAACHILYSNAGTYQGGDKAISKEQKDRPMFHRITVKINETQCIHCHNRGGRAGVSFIGKIESDGYGSPWTTDGEKQGKLHGKNYNHLSPDVHYQKGMTCIDCHTKQDLHGDGNIYAKKEQSVEIECQDCHGTADQISSLKTSWGNPYPNLRNESGKIILTSKLSGKDMIVPQASQVAPSSKGHTAMLGIPGHLEKMECYSCHARWAPQCYGCHPKQDISKPNGDWLDGDSGDLSKASRKENRKKSTCSWQETRSYVRWENPSLGINTEEKVSTFIPGCQVFFTQVGGDKNICSKVFNTVDGTSGIGTNPVQPHTTSKQARTCTECHSNKKVLGLGGGIYNVTANFPTDCPIDFELERFVDENGKQLQQTLSEGARPFNKEEMKRISMVGRCLLCHDAGDKIWKAGGAKAPEDKLHQKSME
jgi:hypothetical protein